MNTQKIKSSVQSSSVTDSEEIKSLLNELSKGRIIDLIHNQKAIRGILFTAAQENPEFNYMSPVNVRREIGLVSKTLTLNDSLEIIAGICGGNILRPYLKYLNTGAEKFEHYKFPEDVRHYAEYLDHEGNPFPFDEPDDYIEPDYFTEYEEEEIVFCQSSFHPDALDCDNFEEFFEAPAEPLPPLENPTKEPLITALEYAPTFFRLESILHGLLGLAAALPEEKDIIMLNSDIKSETLPELEAAKAALSRLPISTLYELVYTNAQFRLDKLTEKINALFPTISKEQIKSNMTLGDISTILYKNSPKLPENLLLSLPHPKNNLYLSIIFELVFLPFYIFKDN